MSHRLPVPSVRTVVFGLASLILLAGLGVTLWGLPLVKPLGQPGAFVDAPVTATDLASQRVSNSPALAADPTAPEFVVAAYRLDGPQLGCALEVSGDGGASWVGANPVPTLPFGVDRCYEPDVAFDRAGTLYYLFAGIGPSPARRAGIYVTASHDRARSFSPPRQILGPLAYGVRMAVGPGGRSGLGRMHLAWLQAGTEPTDKGFASTANRVMAAHSDDGGATVSKAVVVDQKAARVAAPNLAVGPAGAVRVAYYDLGGDARDYEGGPGPRWDGRWRVRMAAWRDGGDRFGEPQTVDFVVPPFRVRSVLSMPPPAIVAGERQACLAWTDARYGDPDVMLRCQADSGRWRATRRVNDDRRGSGYWQQLPQLSMAGNGRIDVVFYDRRDDHHNRAAVVYFAYSYDGSTFSPNVRLSRIRFETDIGPAGQVGSGTGPVELGSRLALLSQGTSSLAAWADARNNYTGLVAQDVYSAKATLLFAAARPAWALPAGVALTAGAGVLLWLLRRRGTAEE